jgi:NitT/TauT family transport system ATP-binding protein
MIQDIHMRVKCEKVSRQFKTRKGVVDALKDINFQTEEQEFLCLLGPSGCGKTTLLRIIAGLLEPTTGRVTFDGARVEDTLTTALVFQEHGVFPWMSVIDNVCFPLETHHVAKQERYRQAMPIIDQLGLTNCIHSYPYQLSSGMKQRVGLARAIVSGAQMLLMDEPFAALDAQMRLISQQQLLEIHGKYHKPVVYVTHDIDEALLLADRIILMTSQPGCIKTEIKLTFPRPRDQNSEVIQALTRLKIEIWRQLKEEVEMGLETVSS